MMNLTLEDIQRLAADHEGVDVEFKLTTGQLNRGMFIGGLIENWGRGLAMMDTLCEGVGLPAPTISDNGSFVWLKFTRPMPLKMTK